MVRLCRDCGLGSGGGNRLEAVGSHQRPRGDNQLGPIALRLHALLPSGGEGVAARELFALLPAEGRPSIHALKNALGSLVKRRLAWKVPGYHGNHPRYLRNLR